MTGYDVYISVIQILNLTSNLFRLTTYFDLKNSSELLAYLGYNNHYEETQLSAFNGNLK